MYNNHPNYPDNSNYGNDNIIICPDIWDDDSRVDLSWRSDSDHPPGHIEADTGRHQSEPTSKSPPFRMAEVDFEVRIFPESKNGSNPSRFHPFSIVFHGFSLVFHVPSWVPKKGPKKGPKNRRTRRSAPRAKPPRWRGRWETNRHLAVGMSYV